MPNVSKEDFLSWPMTGITIAGRKQRHDRDNSRYSGYPGWGEGVWWSDRFGPCSSVVASLGGPAGYEKDLPNHDIEKD